MLCDRDSFSLTIILAVRLAFTFIAAKIINWIKLIAWIDVLTTFMLALGNIIDQDLQVYWRLGTEIKSCISWWTALGIELGKQYLKDKKMEVKYGQFFLFTGVLG